MTAKVRGKKESVIESEIPSFEIFREEIKRIYPEGDLNRAYQRVCWYVEHVKAGKDGTPLSYRLIMDKYAAHIKSWNARYGSRDPKYIGRGDDEKRKNLGDFVEERMYEREFPISAEYSERDTYLFGTFPADYLHAQLEDFKKRFPNETIQPTGKKKTRT
jgi:hypothetical protein